MLYGTKGRFQKIFKTFPVVNLKMAAINLDFTTFSWNLLYFELYSTQQNIQKYDTWIIMEHPVQFRIIINSN